MNSKQLRHRFLPRAVFYMLVMMFIMVQPGFADEKEYSKLDQATDEHNKDDDDEPDDAYSAEDDRSFR